MGCGHEKIAVGERGMRLDAQDKRVSGKTDDLEGDIEIVRVPGWDRFGWLRYGFSTRMGGVSTVYGERVGDPQDSLSGGASALDRAGSLNLGWTKEDDPAAVAENRRRFLGGVWGTFDGFSLVGVRQIHSGVVRVVREGDGAFEGRLQTPEGKAVLEGDGLMTNLPGVLLGVGTADCVPVLVVDVEKRVVGAFHAGWRGTVAQIVEHGVAKMVEEYGSRVEDLVAAVGPSIGACCYTVGEQVRSEFAGQFGYASELFRFEDSGEMRLDLWEANRRQLLEAGLGEGRIAVVGECTACARNAGGARRYFSHRAEKGVAGRMLSVVGVVG
jgi:polyphenol oxidase